MPRHPKKKITVKSKTLLHSEGNTIHNVNISQEELEKKINDTMMEAVKKAIAQTNVYNQSNKQKLDSLRWIGGYDTGGLLKESAQTESPYLDNKNYVENMHASSNLVDYLKEWEGIKGSTKPATKEYYDKAGHKWTIGYGHVENAKERKKYGKGITPEQSNTILANDIITKGENPVKQLFKGYRLTQYEFDALVDLSFNSGPTSMRKSKAAALIMGNSTDENAIKVAFEGISKRAPERKTAEGTMYTTGKYPSPSYLKE